MIALIAALVRRQSFSRGCVAGGVLFAAALAVSWALDRAPIAFPFTAFFPAVLLTSLIGGAAAGLLVAGASALAGWYFFVPPVGSFALPDLGTTVGMLFSWVVLLVNVALIELLSRALRDREAAEAASGRLLEARRTMFHELHHRVANNLQFVVALLALETGRVKDADTARATMRDVQRRLTQMARLHRRLHDPDRGCAEFPEVLREICEDLRTTAGRESIQFQLEVCALDLPPSRLTALGLIVAEAVTNALKHAFQSGDGGVIRVAIAPSGDHQLALTVRDDGPGLPALVAQPGGPEAGKGGRNLGQMVLRSLAGQLQGKLELFNDGGAVTRVLFPKVAR